MEFKKLLMGVAASTLLLGACGNVENHEDSDKKSNDPDKEQHDKDKKSNDDKDNNSK